jgi:hypothetical protein
MQLGAEGEELNLLLKTWTKSGFIRVLNFGAFRIAHITAEKQKFTLFVFYFRTEPCPLYFWYHQANGRIPPNPI